MDGRSTRGSPAIVCHEEQRKELVSIRFSVSRPTVSRPSEGVSRPSEGVSRPSEVAHVRAVLIRGCYWPVPPNCTEAEARREPTSGAVT